MSKRNPRGPARSGPSRMRLLNKLSSEQNHRCAYCTGITNDIPNHRRQATIERVLPGAFGGTYQYYNCVMACARCNSRTEGDKVNNIISRTLKKYGIRFEETCRREIRELLQKEIRKGAIDISQYIFS